MQGRKAPNIIKKLRGTLNTTDDLPEASTKTEKKARPPIVKLGTHGQREYDRVCNYLLLNTLLSETDYNNITIYAKKVDLWYAALDGLENEPETDYQKTGQMNPYNILQKCELTFDTFNKNYGITPNYRLKIPQPKEGLSKKQKFEELFKIG